MVHAFFMKPLFHPSLEDAALRSLSTPVGSLCAWRSTPTSRGATVRAELLGLSQYPRQRHPEIHPLTAFQDARESGLIRSERSASRCSTRPLPGNRNPLSGLLPAIPRPTKRRRSGKAPIIVAKRRRAPVARSA